jgi:hypothetical protein
MRHGDRACGFRSYSLPRSRCGEARSSICARPAEGRADGFGQGRFAVSPSARRDDISGRSLSASHKLEDSTDHEKDIRAAGATVHKIPRPATGHSSGDQDDDSYVGPVWKGEGKLSGDSTANEARDLAYHIRAIVNDCHA